MKALRRTASLPYLFLLATIVFGAEAKFEFHVFATTTKIATKKLQNPSICNKKEDGYISKTSAGTVENQISTLSACKKEASKKKWTVLLYMAADNNLYPFANQNLSQLREIGSNQNVNILVHLDIKVPGKEKVTKRLYVEKNRILQIGADAKLNSGSDETFANAALWAINDYPSEHFAIIFWNHGSGDLNPVLKKTINPAYLFRYNPETNMIDLDRSIGFIDFVDMVEDREEPAINKQNRGICFDETFHSYLDDTKLMRALTKICAARAGKKIDLVIFDACLMAGTGTTWIMSRFAKNMVASEEVVLGPGYNYRTAMTPFLEGKEDGQEIAKLLVASYEQTYNKITNDYTHSAFDLELFDGVCKNIDTVANLLMTALATQRDNSVKNIIKGCRSRYSCTYFDEPSYIDLFHFYANILKKINEMVFTKKQEGEDLRQSLTSAITEGLALAQKFIIANVCGSNLSKARGISIYFPEFKTNNPHHASYPHTEFAQHSKWLAFLQKYLDL